MNVRSHCSLALWQVAAQVEALQAQVALARQVQLRHSTTAVQGLQEQLRSLTTRLAARQVRLGFGFLMACPVATVLPLKVNHPNAASTLPATLHSAQQRQCASLRVRRRKYVPDTLTWHLCA